MPTLHRNPVTGGNRSQGDSSAVTGTTYQNAAHAYKLLRASPAFDERRFLLHGEDKFCAKYNVTYSELLEIKRDARKAEDAAALRVLDQWREAVLFHDGLTQAQKIAALAICNFVNHAHFHCWPSQEALALRLGYSRGPAFGKALKRSFEIGSLTAMTVKALPDDLRTLAVDKSRRSLRGQAYRLNPVHLWAEQAALFSSSQNNPMFHHGTLQGSTTAYLNSELNSQVTSSQEFTPDIDALPSTYMTAATSQNW